MTCMHVFINIDTRKKIQYQPNDQDILGSCQINVSEQFSDQDVQ